MADCEVLILGGGLAGLRAAMELEKAGVDWLLLEGSDRLGGRVQTDTEEGFLLDRGFQILLTAYPEIQSCLDFTSLKLHGFAPGAVVFMDHDTVRMAPDLAGFLNLVSKRIGSPRDLIPLARLALKIYRTDPDQALETASGQPLHRSIRKMDFSPSLRRNFLEPLLAGIHLDLSLNTPDIMLDFVLKMLLSGEAALPQGGMASIVEQIAGHLPPSRIRLNQEATVLEGTRVALKDGTMFQGRNVLLATDIVMAHRLLGLPLPPSGRGVTTCWFASSHSPFGGRPYLMFNRRKEANVLHFACLSDVCPEYAPKGKSLIQATILGTSSWGESFDPEEAALQEARSLFQEKAEDWKLLKTQRIQNAHPHIEKKQELYPGVEAFQRVYLAGDYLHSPNLNSALKSGRLAAQAILASR